MGFTRCDACGERLIGHGSACIRKPVIISRVQSPCNDCAAKDAEIAKLSAERATLLASIIEHSKQLAAARAALDGEREHHAITAQRMMAEQEACDVARRAFRQAGYPRGDGDNSDVADFCRRYDARRAAEAKAKSSRGGEG